MEVVVAKDEISGMKQVYEVPSEAWGVYAGALIEVENTPLHEGDKPSRTFALALSDSFNIDVGGQEYNNLMDAFCLKEPRGIVLGKYNYIEFREGTSTERERPGIPW